MKIFGKITIVMWKPARDRQLKRAQRKNQQASNKAERDNNDDNDDVHDDDNNYNDNNNADGDDYGDNGNDFNNDDGAYMYTLAQPQEAVRRVRQNDRSGTNLGFVNIVKRLFNVEILDVFLFQAFLLSAMLLC